jgi:hypothetical protein
MTRAAAIIRLQLAEFSNWFTVATGGVGLVCVMGEGVVGDSSEIRLAQEFSTSG